MHQIPSIGVRGVSPKIVYILFWVLHIVGHSAISYLLDVKSLIVANDVQLWIRLVIL